MKAEYAHEAVSSVDHIILCRLLRVLGPSTRVTLPVHCSSTLWPLHRTATFPVYRFLCPSFCSGTVGCSRNEEGTHVGLTCPLTFSQPDHQFRKAANYYVCSHCQSWYEQPLGRVVEKVHEGSGHVNYLFKTQAGPTVSTRCPECESTLHVSHSLRAHDIPRNMALKMNRSQVRCGPVLCTILALCVVF